VVGFLLSREQLQIGNMKENNASSWIRLSDLMTALMMVFLLISILYISQVQERQEKIATVVTEYSSSTEAIHEELDSAFRDKYQEWNMVLGSDLSIKFNNPDVLFSTLSSALSDKYKKILDEFIPTYLSIINKPEYRKYIKEVRIEGHTAAWDDYMYSIKLSQDRSNAVLGYIFESSHYKQLPDEDREQLRFWLTSNGLGFGRAIDDNGKFVIESKLMPSSKSRRVEFKIVTSSEAVVETIKSLKE
jgi:outer membrane protein OmpA-like peptidoglycan-associated protein